MSSTAEPDPRRDERPVIWPFSPVQDQIFAFYPPERHPYQILESTIERFVTPETAVLDIGCGRTAPNLVRLAGKARALYGIDLVPFTIERPDLTLVQTSVTDLAGIDDGTIDLAYSRSVMEHIEEMDRAYAEIHRVLRSEGRYIFLTPNFWDYASIISYLVPNRFHGGIVRRTEGRAEEDVFPAFYRSNTKTAVRRLAARHGFAVERLDYMNQYPSYLKFSRPLFYLGCLYGKTIEAIGPLNVLQGWLFCILRKP